MGPNEAPTIPKNPTRWPAAPVTARRALPVTAASVKLLRGTLGSIVLKLLAAMKDEKHVLTMEAPAKRKNMIGAKKPTLAIAEV